MNITGFDKLSLLNFPGRVACTVFTPGCNFKCPFCHNASIVFDKYKKIDEQGVFDFLKERAGIIEGVCVTGGEPLIQPGLEVFLKKIKDMGLEVKVDTNGYMPERLESLIKNKLVDYVAMDIKNSDEKYAKTNGTPCFDINKINKSIEILKKSDIEYEFRTTLVREFHESEDIEKMCKKIEGAKHYYLQNFTDSGDVIQKNLHGLSYDRLNEFLCVAKNYIKSAELRGV